MKFEMTSYDSGFIIHVGILLLETQIMYREGDCLRVVFSFFYLYLFIFILHSFSVSGFFCGVGAGVELGICIISFVHKPLISQDLHCLDCVG